MLNGNESDALIQSFANLRVQGSPVNARSEEQDKELWRGMGEITEELFDSLMNWVDYEMMLVEHAANQMEVDEGVQQDTAPNKNQVAPDFNSEANDVEMESL